VELDVLYVMVSPLALPVMLVMKTSMEFVLHVLQELRIPPLGAPVLLALEEHILQLERRVVQVNLSK